MTRIILSGCNGYMGRALSALIARDADASLIAGFDINTDVPNDYPVFSSPSLFSGEADVVIDFSHPSCLDSLLSFCKDRRIPAVICTTGLSPTQVESIKKASSHIPLFFSANMSLGVNLVMDLIKRAARVLEGDYDMEIVERHHNRKLDAPSGTALAMADAMAEVLKNPPQYVFERHSSRKKRAVGEIGIHAVRGGNIVGDHDVIFAGQNEIIEIRHSASSREVFADGALKAAKYLCSRAPGLYSMKDLVESIG